MHAHVWGWGPGGGGVGRPCLRGIKRYSDSPRLADAGSSGVATCNQAAACRMFVWHKLPRSCQVQF